MKTTKTLKAFAETAQRIFYVSSAVKNFSQQFFHIRNIVIHVRKQNVHSFVKHGQDELFQAMVKIPFPTAITNEDNNKPSGCASSMMHMPSTGGRT